MKGYQIFKDKHGSERVLRHLPPIFIGTVVPYYHITEKTLSSKSFEIEGNNYKIVLDESFQEASDSKFNFLLNKAASFYKYFKEKKNGR